MKARMPVRYFAWMARDALLGPGVVILALVVLMTFVMTRMSVRAAGTTSDAHALLLQIVASFDWIVVLVATAGIVSEDLARGYYRALFSQPVIPALYYLQRWLVGGLVVALYVPLAGFGVLIAHGSFIFSGPLLVRLMLLYLLLGGLTFVISTLLRSDWLIALLVFVLQSALHSLGANGVEVGPMTRGIERALPPFHLGAIGRTVEYPLPVDFAHALLYGAALVAIAVAIVVYRPLGSGGRA
jgi:hypothetical protein